MKRELYSEIYYSLKHPEDIKREAAKRNLPEELMLVIYTQKTVRYATRDYYQIVEIAPALYRRWRRGESIVRLARRLNFPPVLLGLILSSHMGIGRKKFWRLMREPETIEDERLREEFRSIRKADILYSPEGAEVQKKRGINGEEKLAKWLTDHNITFRTEKELRGKFPKTPDFLLKESLPFNGMKIRWIDSKASFGDDIEIRRNHRKQFRQYVELFGDGMVVYWFGIIDDIKGDEHILISDAGILHVLEKEMENRAAGAEK
ncbi:MAG: C15orf41 family protein [Methanomassiliicoccales archaeon]